MRFYGLCSYALVVIHQVKIPELISGVVTTDAVNLPSLMTLGPFGR